MLEEPTPLSNTNELKLEIANAIDILRSVDLDNIREARSLAVRAVGILSSNVLPDLARGVKRMNFQENNIRKDILPSENT